MKAELNQGKNESAEKEAFKQLYTLCKEKCLSKIQRITNNQQDAEDVFAEAISIYWVKSKQGKIKNSKNIPAYVFTIARNLHFTKIKSDVKTEDIHKINPNSLLIDNIWTRKPEEKEKTEKIKNCLNELNEGCRQLLIYKYVYHYSYEELAEKLGRNSADSLKTQTYRCLKKLKELMMKK